MTAAVLRASLHDFMVRGIHPRPVADVVVESEMRLLLGGAPLSVEDGDPAQVAAQFRAIEVLAERMPGDRDAAPIEFEILPAGGRGTHVEDLGAGTVAPPVLEDADASGASVAAASGAADGWIAAPDGDAFGALFGIEGLCAIVRRGLLLGVPVRFHAPGGRAVHPDDFEDMSARIGTVIASRIDPIREALVAQIDFDCTPRGRRAGHLLALLDRAGVLAIDDPSPAARTTTQIGVSASYSLNQFLRSGRLAAARLIEFDAVDLVARPARFSRFCPRHPAPLGAHPQEARANRGY